MEEGNGHIPNSTGYPISLEKVFKMKHALAMVVVVLIPFLIGALVISIANDNDLD